MSSLIPNFQTPQVLAFLFLIGSIGAAALSWRVVCRRRAEQLAADLNRWLTELEPERRPVEVYFHAQGPNVAVSSTEGYFVEPAWDADVVRLRNRAILLSAQPRLGSEAPVSLPLFEVTEEPPPIPAEALAAPRRVPVLAVPAAPLPYQAKAVACAC